MSTSPGQPNRPQYAVVHKCSACGLTRPEKYLRKFDAEFFCIDVGDCSSFQKTGHGLDPWPPTEKKGGWKKLPHPKFRVF